MPVIDRNNHSNKEQVSGPDTNHRISPTTERTPRSLLDGAVTIAAGAEQDFAAQWPTLRLDVTFNNAKLWSGLPKLGPAPIYMEIVPQLTARLETWNPEDRFAIGAGINLNIADPGFLGVIFNISGLYENAFGESSFLVSADLLVSLKPIADAPEFTVRLGPTASYSSGPEGFDGGFVIQGALKL